MLVFTRLLSKSENIKEKWTQYKKNSCPFSLANNKRKQIQEPRLMALRQRGQLKAHSHDK